MPTIADCCPRSYSSPDLQCLPQPLMSAREDAYVLTAVPVSQATRASGPSLMPPPRTLGLRSQDNQYFLLSRQAAEESESYLSALIRNDMHSCRDVHGNYAVPVMGASLRAIIKYLTSGELPPASEYRAVRAAARHLCVSSLVGALDAPTAMPVHFDYTPNWVGLFPVPSEQALELLQTYYCEFDSAIDTAIEEATANPVRLRLRPKWMARSANNRPASLAQFSYVPMSGDANEMPSYAIAILWREISNALVIRGADGITHTLAYNDAFTGQNGVKMPIYADISFTLPSLGESQAGRVAREAAEVDAKSAENDARRAALAERERTYEAREADLAERQAKLDAAEMQLTARDALVRGQKQKNRVWSKVFRA